MYDNFVVGSVFYIQYSVNKHDPRSGGNCGNGKLN